VFSPTNGSIFDFTEAIKIGVNLPNRSCPWNDEQVLEELQFQRSSCTVVVLVLLIPALHSPFSTL